jgi:diaminopimelate epimerase
MRIVFSKYEGLGNDFVLVDGLDGAQRLSLTVEAARQICDRHRGIGGDGVLVLDAPAARPRMRVINADGSVPEMCGNGIRCVALHLARIGRASSGAFEIDTDAGPHVVRVLERGESGVVEVAMRAASLQPDEVPVRAPAALCDEPLELGGPRLRWTAVSMGNPHAVTFDDAGSARAELAPRVQTAVVSGSAPALPGGALLFPHGVNVGFAQMRGPNALELAVFERGSGWTEACGTGACAAAVAAVETGRAQRGQAIAVQLPGGTLTIVVPEPGERVLMTGPARHVFDGEVEL